MITKDERALLRSKITMHFPMDLLSKLVLDGASGREILVYMLYFHQSTMSKNEEFFCRLSVDQLCKLSGSSKSTINRANSSLIEKGWLHRNTKDVKATRSESGVYRQEVSKTFPCIPKNHKHSVLNDNRIRKKHSPSKSTDNLRIELKQHSHSAIEASAYSNSPSQHEIEAEKLNTESILFGSDTHQMTASSQSTIETKTIDSTVHRNGCLSKQPFMSRPTLDRSECELWPSQEELQNDSQLTRSQLIKASRPTMKIEINRSECELWPSQEEMWPAKKEPNNDSQITKSQFINTGSPTMAKGKQIKIEGIKACTSYLNAQFIEFALKRNDPSLLHFLDKSKIEVHELNFIYETVIEREDETEEIKRKNSTGGDLYAINIADANVRSLIRKKLQKLFQSRLKGEAFKRRERLVCWLYEKHSKDQSLNPSKQIDLLLQSIKKPTLMELKQDSMPYDYDPLPDDLINHIEHCRKQHKGQLLAA